MAKWAEGKYSFWTAHLADGLRIVAHWEEGTTEPGKPYVASALGLRLVRRFATLEEAKAAAERAARQVLTRALAALDEGE